MLKLGDMAKLGEDKGAYERIQMISRREDEI